MHKIILTITNLITYHQLQQIVNFLGCIFPMVDFFVIPVRSLNILVLHLIYPSFYSHLLVLLFCNLSWFSIHLFLFLVPKTYTIRIALNKLTCYILGLFLLIENVASGGILMKLLILQ